MTLNTLQARVLRICGGSAHQRHEITVGIPYRFPHAALLGKALPLACGLPGSIAFDSALDFSTDAIQNRCRERRCRQEEKDEEKEGMHASGLSPFLN